MKRRSFDSNRNASGDSVQRSTGGSSTTCAGIKSIARFGGLAAAALAGIAAWRLSRRWRIPVHHRTEMVPDVPSTPHRLSPDLLNANPPVQLLRDGVGPLFHRRY